MPLHSKDTLPQTTVRIGVHDLNGGPAREHERGIDVVQRTLARGLNEREKRCGKRGRDTRLFDPGQAVSRPNDEAVAQPEGKSHSGSEVQLFELSRGSGLPILSQKVELLGLKIEDGGAIIYDRGWEVQRVANAEV